MAEEGESTVGGGRQEEEGGCRPHSWCGNEADDEGKVGQMPKMWGCRHAAHRFHDSRCMTHRGVRDRVGFSKRNSNLSPPVRARELNGSINYGWHCPPHFFSYTKTGQKEPLDRSGGGCCELTRGHYEVKRREVGGGGANGGGVTRSSSPNLPELVPSPQRARDRDVPCCLHRRPGTQTKSRGEPAGGLFFYGEPCGDCWTVALYP